MHDQSRDSAGKNELNEKPVLESPKFDTTKTVIVPETDLDKLNRFLITIGSAEIGIRRKILMVKKFIDVLGYKED